MIKFLPWFSSHPLISVVIPAYNSSKTIIDTVNSVLNQTYKNVEVLVVDDGSTDDTVECVKSIRDTRVKVFPLKGHVNANVARNYGIDHARGKYIAFLDSDDRYLPEHLGRKLSVLRKYKKMGYDGVYGGVYVQHADKPLKPYPVKKRLPGESMIDYLLRCAYSAQTSTQLMTAKSARAIKYDPDLYRHQDYDFLCRYHRRFKMLADRHITVIYNNNPKNIPQDELVRKFESCVRFIKANMSDIKNPFVLLRYLQFMRQHSLDLVGPKFVDDFDKMIAEVSVARQQVKDSPTE